jgi:hypothetical protein
MHLVTLRCRDADAAAQCLAALAAYGRPDALAYGCAAYEFGPCEGKPDTVILVERWWRWSDLDRLLGERVLPALPIYNQLLRAPFDPESDTVRVMIAPSAGSGG